MKDLELRMYGFVPYNISEIQKGIQFGHAVVELCQKLRSHKEWKYELDKYDNWANNWRTFIILNGGTSNHSTNKYSCDDFSGTMEQHLKYLQDLEVTTGEFYEPDLNDMLSAIVFIVDERVFNKKDYPDFTEFIKMNYTNLIDSDYTVEEAAQRIKESEYTQDKKAYQQWLTLIGGERNEKLRDFLKNFRLA
jgi:hypothetical protein